MIRANAINVSYSPALVDVDVDVDGVPPPPIVDGISSMLQLDEEKVFKYFCKKYNYALYYT